MQHSVKSVFHTVWVFTGLTKVPSATLWSVGLKIRGFVRLALKQILMTRAVAVNMQVYCNGASEKTMKTLTDRESHRDEPRTRLLIARAKRNRSLSQTSRPFCCNCKKH